MSLQSLSIGWIGCGVMGLPMAMHCLKKGQCSLAVHNRTKAKCQPLIDEGARYCDSPEKVVSTKPDVFFTMVGHPADLEQVVFGSAGILPALKKTIAVTPDYSPILVDLTTTKPSLSQRIAEEAGKLGVLSLDSPVTGGDIGAQKGSLTVMVGGDEKAFNKVKPLLQCFAEEKLGGNIQLMGGPGSGQHTKMVNQILVASNMIGVCEALLYASKAGLEDVEHVVKTLANGAAGSWSWRNLAPKILSGNLDPGFLVEHIVKDMEIALDEARRLNLCLPGLALVHQLYVSLKASGEAKLGTQALYLTLERMNGMAHKTAN